MSIEEDAKQKSRKTGTSSTATRVQRVNTAQQEEEWMHYTAAQLSADGENENSSTPTPDTPTADIDELEEEDDTDTSSAFSLQECINEFRARRIRRISTQSREVVEECVRGGDGGTAGASTAKEFVHAAPADADLIDQNRSNKEQERKCKPCENGFCYCFTSDSGDGGGCTVAATTGTMRQSRRIRKSESSQVPFIVSQHRNAAKPKDRHRQSAPANIKSPSKSQTLRKHDKSLACASAATDQNSLTAISRLESATSADAPLIHIIQELRDNCVISEVRVNKYKIAGAQRNNQRANITKNIDESFQSTPLSSPRKKTQFQIDAAAAPPSPSKAQHFLLKQLAPSMPVLSRISESPSEGLQSSSPLDTSSGSNRRKRHKAAGRLLHKRLSYGVRNASNPPPKPPRSCAFFDEKMTVSSLASTTPSVRDAERILDEFLKRKGYTVPTRASQQARPHTLTNWPQSSARDMGTQYEADVVEERATHRDQRKSYPLTQREEKSHFQKPLPSCPSLSDIERESTKKYSHYEKNIRHPTEKQVKELHFGWAEPKINDMLNCGTNINGKEFHSRSAQAEPQAIGWQMPPKVELDTVDGAVRGNLAWNIETKGTPVKTRLFSAHKQRPNDSQRFIWGERLSSLSPWSNQNTPRETKSCFKATSRSFLKSSKKKILRLVSPKKDNKERRPFEVRKTPLRVHSIGVQTSREDLRPYEPSSSPQSPPGSYHSAVQTSHQSTTLSRTTTSNDNTPIVEKTPTPPARRFDFTRQIMTPPKKAPRTSQRKLNFPSSSARMMRDRGGGDGPTMTKTYRSYQSDLDQDVTISKMGDILRNIRAKLEASDERAIRTFKEVERREQGAGFDCPDSHRSIRAETKVEIQRNTPRRFDEGYNDPIYSEIEEDSIHILGSPQFDNRTGSQRVCDPSVLYAKVNKKAQKQTAPPATGLGKLLHDSLKSLHPILPPLPSVPEPDSSGDSYAIPSEIFNAATSHASNLAHCQSMNNIRVMEQHSPPKRNRNLSKSDISLHRSEIFLENLCCSEIVVEGTAGHQRLEKVNNLELNQSHMAGEHLEAAAANDSVISYELPEEGDADLDTAGSNFRVGATQQLNAHNQSTPISNIANEARTYITQHFTENEMPLNVSIDVGDSSRGPQPPPMNSHSRSCPTSPLQLPPPTPDAGAPLSKPHAGSLNEVYAHNHSKNNNSQKISSPYKWLKNTLQRSFRRSKRFLKCDSKRLSTSLQSPSGQSSEHKGTDRDQCDVASVDCTDASSSFNLDAVLEQGDVEPIAHQLVKAVSICRQLPALEISTEMVEAERLLLYATLCSQADKEQRTNMMERETLLERPARRFYIDAMRLPVRPDVHQDLFFNMFYICTFECGGVIRSTQSAECQDGEAIFRDCGIELAFKSTSLDADAEVRCAIFMLRLRKVSTLSLEPPRKPLVKLPNLADVSADSSTSCEDIVSRFRLHACFTLNASSFAPYEYVECASKDGDTLCLRASTTCNIPLSPRTKSTNLSYAVELTGRAEIRCVKRQYCGFLNVQDPHYLHNWNRRWCTLNGLKLCVWQDTNDTISEPLLSLDLCDSLQTTPLVAASAELCARPRSFLLQCAIQKANEEVGTAAVFFAAESQVDLANWLQQLNAVLEFALTWMR